MGTILERWQLKSNFETLEVYLRDLSAERTQQLVSVTVTEYKEVEEYFEHTTLLVKKLYASRATIVFNIAI